MGMFDNVIVEVPIEGVENPAAMEWQTKDFDMPAMDVYKISAEGRLLHERVHYEDRSDKNAEPGSLKALWGCMTPIHEGWDDLEYHGDVSMVGRVEREWIDVTARFTEGQLTWIRRDAPPASPSEPRET